MRAERSNHAGLLSVDSSIHNATGIRVRDYPITLDKLLDGLPQLTEEKQS